MYLLVFGHPVVAIGDWIVYVLPVFGHPVVAIGDWIVYVPSCFRSPSRSYRRLDSICTFLFSVTHS